MTLILGLETSCDETAAAVVEDGRWVRSNIVATQHELHERYRGVVPEIASRAHLERISPVMIEALATAGATVADLDAVAVGNRPGLIGSLLIGVSAAKTLAWAAEKPLIGIDHVRAHLYAAALEDGKPPATSHRPPGGRRCEVGSRKSEVGRFGSPRSETRDPRHGFPDPRPQTPDPPPYPALGLVVSGGHTSLYEGDSPTDMRRLGGTIDDAVGEAYDKAAVILQLGYPGGPNLDKLAHSGDPAAYDLPRSLLEKDSLDFSFSGLKTALLYTVRGKPRGRGREATFERSADDLSEAERRNLAAAFQQAAIETLIIKLGRAIATMADWGRPPRSLIIGGGVSANSLLRRRAAELGEQAGLAVCLPKMAYCLDNAAMIAGLAHHDLLAGRCDDLDLPAIATTAW